MTNYIANSRGENANIFKAVIMTKNVGFNINHSYATFFAHKTDNSKPFYVQSRVKNQFCSLSNFERILLSFH